MFISFNDKDILSTVLTKNHKIRKGGQSIVDFHSPFLPIIFHLIMSYKFIFRISHLILMDFFGLCLLSKINKWTMRLLFLFIALQFFFFFLRGDDENLNMLAIYKTKIWLLKYLSNLQYK